VIIFTEYPIKILLEKTKLLLGEGLSLPYLTQIAMLKSFEVRSR